MQGRAPAAGDVGRAVYTVKALGWVPQGVWWRWRVLGQGELLDLVAKDWALLRHRMRESLQRVALLRVEMWRPQTSGGRAGAIDRRACQAGLACFHGDTELSLLRGLLIGATWTASRAGKQRMRPTLRTARLRCRRMSGMSSATARAGRPKGARGPHGCKRPRTACVLSTR